MSRFDKRIALLAAPLAAAGAFAFGGVAHAAPAPTTVTATTHVTNRPDGGHGGTWAYDNFQRTLTVTVAATQNPADTTAGLVDYTATITDKGQFSAIVGADAPNQVVAGVKVTHGVTGSLNGTYSLTVTAPVADTLTGVVPATENDNFAAPANTTDNWPKLAFATPVGVTVTGGAYSWKYATACETWVDSSVNGDGNLAGDGNITGRICAVPRLYDGHAVYVAPTRENVEFKQTIASVDKFVIVGPGAINGHVGWVNAKGGGVLNTGVYSGLEAGHGYTVLYTPYTRVNGRQIPGTHTGYVFFVSNVPFIRP
jgi:hypothetical protein